MFVFQVLLRVPTEPTEPQGTVFKQYSKIKHGVTQRMDLEHIQSADVSSTRGLYPFGFPFYKINSLISLEAHTRTIVTLQGHFKNREYIWPRLSMFENGDQICGPISPRTDHRERRLASGQSHPPRPPDIMEKAAAFGEHVNVQAWWAEQSSA